jgi:hypothetical protein
VLTDSLSTRRLDKPDGQLFALSPRTLFPLVHNFNDKRIDAKIDDNFTIIQQFAKKN